MSSKVKVVFFDLDDTLYDHTYHIESAIAHLREQYSFLQAYSLPYLQKLSHDLLEEVHERLLRGEISVGESRQIRWQRFLEEVKYERAEEDAIMIADVYLKAYYAAERVVPGTFELLGAVKKGYEVGIISNNLLDEQLKKMQRLGISKFIDIIAISEEVGAAKPDRKIFDTALERAKSDASEAVYIGDSWANDVLGAIGVGIRPIWFNRKADVSCDPSVLEIRSLQDIEKILGYIRSESETPQITSPEPARE